VHILGLFASYHDGAACLLSDGVKTVLLVSHDLQQVRENCRRAVWIHKGHLVRDGDAEAVTAAYYAWSLTGSETPPAPSVPG
jgi:teichoic acid transport system ATP-binding protein